MWERRHGGWKLTLGELSWWGKKKADVQKEAFEELSVLFNGLRLGVQPKVLPVPDNPDAVMVIYCGIRGNFIAQQFEPVACLPHDAYKAGCATISNETTRVDAEVRVRRDLAQRAWAPDKDVAHWLDPDDAEGRKELAGWIEWQMRYRAGKEAGFCDVDAHAFASGTLGMCPTCKGPRGHQRYCECDEMPF